MIYFPFFFLIVCKDGMLKGGVVNKNPGSDNFDSIVKMIKHKRCKISCVSFSSIKGFIFKINVEELKSDKVEFYGLNKTNRTFDVPVDTLVIKMAILYTGGIESDRILMLPDYQPILTESKRKEMEYVNDFRDEAIAQSEIYEQTLSKGEPICPALIDLSHFTSIDSSVPFLRALEKKAIDDESRNMISYITKMLTETRDCQLGMITMESAVTFESFYTAFDKQSIVNPATMQISGYNGIPPSPEQLHLCGDVIIEIIRLFNECKIVHCDLHGENVLVDTKTNKILIIDFGRILRIDRLHLLERKIAHQFAIDFFVIRSFFDKNRDFKISPKIQHNVSTFDINYVKLVLSFILSIEYMYNKTRFDRDGQSKIKNTYSSIFVLTPSAKPTYTAITAALNAYYSREIECSISEREKYKTVKTPGKRETVPETLCEKLQETKGSPSRIEFTARSPPEVVRSRRKRESSTGVSGKSNKSMKRSSGFQRHSNSSNLDVYSFPDTMRGMNFSNSISASGK